MPIPSRIAIVGDYDATMYTHVAIDDSLRHVRELRQHAVEWSWISTSSLATNVEAQLALIDAIWLAPGSPYASFDGALSAVRFARERGIPFLGVCGGFQHAIIEFARNVAGLNDADHAESNHNATTPVISALACTLVGKAAPIFLDPTCRTASIYGRWRIVERYHCSYGVNPLYRDAIERAGLRITGEDDRGEARVIELPEHPFFVATLFQPQLASSADAPAPLVRALVDAAIFHRDHRPTPSSTASVVAGMAT
jgi:CTP synthase (UTP-ammonia lyase)